MRHVAVSGLIGAGTSTLVKRLGEVAGYRSLVEGYAENPFVERFYEWPERWALRSLLWFVEENFRQEAAARTGRVASVQERTIEENVEIFAAEFRDRGYLTDDDVAVLEGLTGTARSLLGPVPALIHVDVSPEFALARIATRGRSAERAIELTYLDAISERYERFLNGWPGPLVRISSEEIDLRDPSAVGELWHRVAPVLSEGSRVSQPS